MDNSSLDGLLSRIRDEAAKGGFSVDAAAYASVQRDPLDPILFAGNLDARLAVMGRDLGIQEVRYAEPLIGDAGRRVREAIYETVVGDSAPSSDRRLPDAMEHVLLTNTVPYKPVSNKAYPTAVKERFRPFIEEFLIDHWRGHYVVTLGTEAFKWYAPYAPRGAADDFWSRPDRYEAEFACEIAGDASGSMSAKQITVAPLPHPSPLNQTYWAVFPEMLKKRLSKLFPSP